MPEIARFQGIVVRMYHNDHSPPHFHSKHGGKEAKIGFTGAIPIAGKLPPRKMKALLAWAKSHEAELLTAWSAIRNREPPSTIVPP